MSYEAPFYFCFALIAIDLMGPIIIKDTIRKPKKINARALDLEEAYEATHLTVGPAGNHDSHCQALADTDTGDVADAHFTDDTSPDTAQLVVPDKPHKKVVKREIKYTSFDLLKQFNLWVLYIITIFAASAWGGLEPILPFFLVDAYQFDSAKVGLYFLVPVVPSLIFSPVCGWLYDRYGLKVCIPGTLLTAIVVACFGIPDASTPPYVILVLLLLYGMTGSFVLTPIMPELSQNVPRSMTARIYGIWNMFFSLGLFVSRQGF